ncbi:hypothetical protein CMUS01_13796 [Colletotrichum musicola]|uniref:Uncharacterized protein n=1 Tax=Colletotrichum musicola TaxID=2175873 RepID=A0A8H6J9F5_9PEZI|nr:hypothetical protein CMUS01_13796 [Colletotrichum musicola]
MSGTCSRGRPTASQDLSRAAKAMIPQEQQLTAAARWARLRTQTPPPPLPPTSSYRTRGQARDTAPGAGSSLALHGFPPGS